MQHRSLLIFIFSFLIPLSLWAQADAKNTDITGLWKGTLYNDTTGQTYKYEIGISKEKGKLSGFSHTWFILDDKQYYGVKKVKIKIAGDGKIIVEDNGLIANNYPVEPPKNVRQLNVLTLEIRDSIMILTGPYSTNRTKDYHSLTGSVSLQRKNDFWQSALVPHLQELRVEEELSFVKEEREIAKVAADKKIAEEVSAEKNIAALKRESVVKETVNTRLASTVTVKEVQPTGIQVVTSPIEKTPAEKEAIAEAEQKEKERIAALVIAEEKKEAERNLAIQNKKAEEKIKTVVESKATEVVIAKEETQQPVLVKQEDQKSKLEVSASQTPSREKINSISRSFLPAADVASRINVVQQTVFYSSDSLQLTLYDNGEVDGDTVSVLMNGNIIMARQGLSTNAVRKTINAGSQADSIELVMYAENLGTIAPNTGLLVVRDGKSIYEIRFSGDLKKNAAIIFKRRKNP